MERMMQTIVESVLGIGVAIALTILAAITARASSGVSAPLSYAQTNADMESPASIGPVALAVKDFFGRNSFVIIACAIIGVFIVVTMVRPSRFLPAHDESALLASGLITGTLKTNTGRRHVEEGDAFEVDLSVSGKRAKGAKCPAASLTATAVAPGVDLASAQRLAVSDVTCAGSASWLVGTKRGGRVIVAVTLAKRDVRAHTTSDVTSAAVGTDVERGTQLSDALVGGIAALFAALITSLSAKKS